MIDFCKIIGSIVWKDILLESRTKDILLSVILFASLVLLIFNFAVDFVGFRAVFMVLERLF